MRKQISDSAQPQRGIPAVEHASILTTRDWVAAALARNEQEHGANASDTRQLRQQLNEIEQSSGSATQRFSVQLPIAVAPHSV